jgi:hypothetical protein
LQKFEEISKAQLKKLTKIFQLEQRKSEKREEKEVWFAEILFVLNFLLQQKISLIKKKNTYFEKLKFTILSDILLYIWNSVNLDP